MVYARVIRAHQHKLFKQKGYLVGPDGSDAFKEYVRKMTGQELVRAERFMFGSSYYEETFAMKPQVENVLDNKYVQDMASAALESLALIGARYPDGFTFVIKDDISPNHNPNGKALFHILYTVYAFAKGAYNIDDISVQTTVEVQ